MVPISAVTSPARHRVRQHKPQSPVGTNAKNKMIRLDAAQLKLIERAARSLNPPPSSSYFIVQAAIARAQEVLAS